MTVLDTSPPAVIACDDVRSEEATILLQAISELHRDGVLTSVEYESKRAHLAACL